MIFDKSNDGSSLTLRIRGELDAFTAPELRPFLDEVEAPSAPKKVVVDLSGLTLIDSSGVGAIVSLFKRVRAREGELVLMGLTGQPLAIFKLLNLDRVFSILPAA